MPNPTADYSFWVSQKYFSQCITDVRDHHSGPASSARLRNESDLGGACSRGRLDVVVYSRSRTWSGELTGFDERRLESAPRRLLAIDFAAARSCTCRPAGRRLSFRSARTAARFPQRNPWRRTAWCFAWWCWNALGRLVTVLTRGARLRGWHRGECVHDNKTLAHRGRIVYLGDARVRILRGKASVARILFRRRRRISRDHAGLAAYVDPTGAY